MRQKLVKQKRLLHSLSHPYTQKQHHHIHAVTMQISDNEMLIMFLITGGEREGERRRAGERECVGGKVSRNNKLGNLLQSNSQTE